LGVRGVLQVGDFILEQHGTGEAEVSANVLYRWRGSDDSITKHNESTRLFDELSLHTGMNKDEVINELKNKQSVLDWMVKQNISDLNSVGRVVANYYNDPELVLSSVNKNKPLEE
ncbi:MAG: hypothetical protein NTY48_07090, partial [Candidatus Diapherotrites archaeon]|nr:hypothetical protein [Candidatus Diapherotrites archaeon]